VIGVAAQHREQDVAPAPGYREQSLVVLLMLGTCSAVGGFRQRDWAGIGSEVSG
jgi:hypothetical protein